MARAEEKDTGLGIVEAPLSAAKCLDWSVFLCTVQLCQQASTLLQPPVYSTLKITNRSFHLWNNLPPTLRVLISLVHHHHPALLHHHALILDRLSTFLMAFSTLVLKPSFSQSLSLHNNLSLAQANLLEFEFAECDRLSQSSLLLGALQYSFTYLFMPWVSLVKDTSTRDQFRYSSVMHNILSVSSFWHTEKLHRQGQVATSGSSEIKHCLGCKDACLFHLISQLFA